MSCGHRSQHLLPLRSEMQVAIAAAIGAAEAGDSHELFSNSFRDAALHVPGGPGGEGLHQAGRGQQIVDVPASCCLFALQHLDVAVHALEAAGTHSGTGIRIEASGKVDCSQRANRNLGWLRQEEHQRVNSRLISLRLHASSFDGAYLSLMLYGGNV